MSNRRSLPLVLLLVAGTLALAGVRPAEARDRKSTRLNSSHSQISYAVFCLKKKKKTHTTTCDESTRSKTTSSIPTSRDPNARIPTSGEPTPETPTSLTQTREGLPTDSTTRR